MASLHEDVKAQFTAARYMDDILLLTAKGDWDSERFHADFQASECYMPPLKLEAPVWNQKYLVSIDFEFGGCRITQEFGLSRYFR